MKPLTALVSSVFLTGSSAWAQTPAPGTPASPATGGGIVDYWWILLVIVVIAAVWYFMRNRRQL
jgi:hypothetical protein